MHFHVTIFEYLSNLQESLLGAICSDDIQHLLVGQEVESWTGGTHFLESVLHSAVHDLSLGADRAAGLHLDTGATALARRGNAEHPELLRLLREQ